MHYALSLVMLFTIVASGVMSATAEEKPVQIPLKEVWAKDMPGTRNIRDLEPERFGDQVKEMPDDEQNKLHLESLIAAIGNSLTMPRRSDNWITSGFTVAGVGKNALRQARDILAKKRPISESLPANEPVTLVFFAWENGVYVHLESIKRRGRVITVKYEFVSHLEHELTWHFALIPLGKLDDGNWKVIIEQAPVDPKYSGYGWKPEGLEVSRQLVSQSFDFVIEAGASSRTKPHREQGRLSSPTATDGFASDPVTIPPAKMMTTSDQEGMQRVGELFQRANEQEFGHSGASNAFLVDAANLNDAVGATGRILLGSRAADIPASNELGPVSGRQWLVAFLGAAHSSPVRWVVEKVAVTENNIRLTYHKPESAIATSDIHRYYYWVPLGKLAPGTYQVELFDADEKAVTLMRRVKVEAKPK
jgi:hypothetical protein